MLTSKRFKLGSPTVAIAEVEGKRTAVTIPAEAIINVISGPTNGGRMIDVLWEGRVLEMFAVDLKTRGTEIVGESSKL